MRSSPGTVVDGLAQIPPDAPPGNDAERQASNTKEIVTLSHGHRDTMPGVVHVALAVPHRLQALRLGLGSGIESPHDELGRAGGEVHFRLPQGPGPRTLAVDVGRLPSGPAVRRDVHAADRPPAAD